MAARTIQIVSVDELPGGQYQMTYSLDGNKKMIRWQNIALAVNDISARADDQDILLTMVLQFAYGQDNTLKSMAKLAGQTLTFDMSQAQPVVVAKT